MAQESFVHIAANTLHSPTIGTQHCLIFQPNLDSTKPHVMSGLIAKRSELAGLIEHYMKEVKRMAVDLQHLDATIKLFDPDCDLRAIRTKQFRKRNAYFKSGECARLVLEVLRTSESALSTDAIALAIMERKKLDSGDTELVKFTKKASITALRQQASCGFPPIPRTLLSSLLR